ncbi:cupin domain-containing protein [Ignatzschineria rhizosphaerae]|uniref:Cupin domain-containing protein n=1 Tax=Ignatzschineria rhizosphaerae TaxID=2923279 RepID=A0ABY3X348_9GAMM|nr:cupin domain-containing protein [Ignatzschineria rhizosphaerae]UNM97302.1 cupin domain-containing protein [Ignatzschineria rhizosphaerae]
MLLGIHKINSLDELDSWGTVADLGSTILEGDGKAYGKFTIGNPEVPINGGYFAVTKGKFRMTYPFTEQATIVKGELSLTNEETGEVLHLKEGDSFVAEKGTKVLWDVKSDFFVKHYLSAI